MSSTMQRWRATLDDRVRRILTPLVRALARARITPNQVSVAGLALTALAAVMLAGGGPVAAGMVFLLASGLDLLDGLLARIDHAATRFGAFLDSTFDRVGEGLIFTALAYRFALAGEPVLVACTALALLGSVLVSYSRARAEGLGVSCTVGLLSRPERVLLIAGGLIFGVIGPVIYLVAALTLWTAGQRILYVRKQLQAGNPP